MRCVSPVDQAGMMGDDVRRGYSCWSSTWAEHKICAMGLIELWAMLARHVSSAITCTGVPCGTGSVPRELARLFYLGRLHLEDITQSGESFVVRVRVRRRGNPTMYCVVGSTRSVPRIAERAEGASTEASR